MLFDMLNCYLKKSIYNVSQMAQLGTLYSFHQVTDVLKNLRIT
jgi:hypothetical protein